MTAQIECIKLIAAENELNRLNDSMLYNSLRYIKSNFIIIVQLSVSIKDILAECNYSDRKFQLSLHRNCLEISEQMVNYVKDPRMLHKLLYDLVTVNTINSCNLRRIAIKCKFLLKHGASSDYHFYEKSAIESVVNNFNTVRFLLDNDKSIWKWKLDHQLLQQEYYKHFLINILQRHDRLLPNN